MPQYIKLFEDFEQVDDMMSVTFYHGCNNPNKTEFGSFTYLTDSIEQAKTYGEYVYSFKLKTNNYYYSDDYLSDEYYDYIDMTEEKREMYYSEYDYLIYAGQLDDEFPETINVVTLKDGLLIKQ